MTLYKRNHCRPQLFFFELRRNTKDKKPFLAQAVQTNLQLFRCERVRPGKRAVKWWRKNTHGLLICPAEGLFTLRWELNDLLRDGFGKAHLAYGVSEVLILGKSFPLIADESGGLHLPAEITQPCNLRYMLFISHSVNAVDPKSHCQIEFTPYIHAAYCSMHTTVHTNLTSCTLIHAAYTLNGKHYTLICTLNTIIKHPTY